MWIYATVILAPVDIRLCVAVFRCFFGRLEEDLGCIFCFGCGLIAVYFVPGTSVSGLLSVVCLQVLVRPLFRSICNFREASLQEQRAQEATNIKEDPSIDNFPTDADPSNSRKRQHDDDDEENDAEWREETPAPGVLIDEYMNMMLWVSFWACIVEALEGSCNDALSCVLDFHGDMACHLGKLNDCQILSQSQMSSTSLILRSTQLILDLIKGIDFLEFQRSEIASTVVIYVVGIEVQKNQISAIFELAKKVAHCVFDWREPPLLWTKGIILYL
ncbi:hypothetical protein Tco_1024418 [Tanacetum coccineum]